VNAAPATAPVALTADAVSKTYGERRALQDVSFTAHRGERIAIIGPNGAGKTTLLQILAGSLKPSGGTVALEAGTIGWVPQQPALYSKLSVAENLRLFARLEKRPDVGASVERMLDQTNLRERADDEVGKLSGGNRQRVNIAIGLLAEPPVLLLDEPSAALDPRQRERLWEFIGELAGGGTTVLYATHYIQEVDRADQVIVIADGERIFAGSPEDLEHRAAEATGERSPNFEAAFVAFLREKGH